VVQRNHAETLHELFYLFNKKIKWYNMIVTWTVEYEYHFWFYFSISSTECNWSSIYFNLTEAGTKWLTFFVVIDELRGTARTDHLDSRTSKTHVSASPKNLFLVRSCHTTG
jgi:hypothetical protein